MFKRLCIIVLSIFLSFIICGCSIFSSSPAFSNSNDTKNADVNSSQSKEDSTKIEKSKFWISGNSLQAFDLCFLQLENSKKNKIYSPLSIKYALKMLEEGATGESKLQISNLIGNYKIKNYTNSKNMSFANAIFIKDTYKNTVYDAYIKSLLKKYNADVMIDSFATPNNVNSWMNRKTLGLIKNPFDDISKENLMLINALAINMEWKSKFFDGSRGAAYRHINFYWSASEEVESHSFNGVNEEISGMEIGTSYNDYDIVKILGEDYIRKTVTKAYKEYVKENNLNFGDELYWGIDSKTMSGQEKLDLYLDEYIKEIDSNYKAFDKSTDFSFYVDKNVKVFAKDLKKYNGTTLQYIGIMPTKENLNSYISKATPLDINNLIGKLKEVKPENFKKGVVTKITGYIPKFKFEYDLNLMNDLKSLGVTNVFESGKANLTNISSDKSLFIGKAAHKANIEFTQDGIKASAATYIGGLGAGDTFDYLFEVPVEEIDLTFDKPFMFIIRDKASGDVWFTGTVYTPLLYSNDKTTSRYYNY